MSITSVVMIWIVAFAVLTKKYIYIKPGHFADTKPPIKWVLDVTIAYANGHPLGK
jgi:hypothetical protein